jgi:hypothetical protein
VPALHQATRTWVQQGKLLVLGVAQEQHPDRCRLFAQWKHLDWPIVYDPINVLGVTGVPVEVAVDEHGIVRSTRPNLKTFEEEFLNKAFPPDAAGPLAQPAPLSPPDPVPLRRRAEEGRSAEAWRQLGDALALWGGIDRVDEAIDAYARAIRFDPDDGDAQFRLGVCYRIRYESPRRLSDDFRAAVDHWGKARAIQPNQYIWRRRMEQYGPRLTKPYPFYDWMETAANEIRARGEQPVELRVLPTGSELAQPAERSSADQDDVQPPDPHDRVHPDTAGLVLAEVTVVPPRVKPGQSARVHVSLRLNTARKAHWNNEAEPLRLWVEAPPGWQLERHLLRAPQGRAPETSEPRQLELDVRAPADARGTAKLHAYALYYVCEDVRGKCQFLRLDIPIEVAVDK